APGWCGRTRSRGGGTSRKRGMAEENVGDVVDQQYVLRRAGYYRIVLCCSSVRGPGRMVHRNPEGTARDGALDTYCRYPHTGIVVSREERSVSLDARRFIR